MKKQWNKDMRDQLKDFPQKAPEGLLDDIKSEMTRRGLSPAPVADKPKHLYPLILRRVADRLFSDEEISRLSVVAPNVQLNIIRDFEVVEKKQVIMPDVVKGIVKCGNPKCITNNEPMTTIFHVLCKENGVLKCHYCEKEQNKESVKLL